MRHRVCGRHSDTRGRHDSQFTALRRSGQSDRAHTYDPPGETGAWHYHPGYAFNVVKSGTLTVEDGCGGEETLTPGQAFEEMDGRVHRAKNLSATEDVVVYNTFIVPQGIPTTTRNIPGNENSAIRFQTFYHYRLGPIFDLFRVNPDF